MNNFDEWSQIIARFLKAEADLLTSVEKHDIGADSTRAAFVRGVLDPFLPSSYAIGSGRIVDSSGQSSDHIDIVIYRRDFPRLNLPGSSDVFLYESVLATIEVRTKLIRKTLFNALNTCASVSRLNPGIDAKVLKNIAAHNQLKLNHENKYVHEHPLLTDRFNLIGRPPGFIYGFSGFQTSPAQLNENIKIWIEQCQKNNQDIDLKLFPAVIATQGCIGWRNAAPLSANSNHLFGIGADSAPIRLIVFQLLYQLNRRLKLIPDGSGLKPNLEAYLKQMAPPEIQHAVGKATHAATSAPKASASSKPKPKPALKPKPEATPKAVTKTEPVAESKPDSEPDFTLGSRPVFEASPVPNSPAPKPVAETATELKPGPAPKPLPRPTLHSESSTGEMPIPDAGLIPEPEPDPEPETKSAPLIATPKLSSSGSESPSSPVVPENKKQPEATPKPEPKSDPLMATPKLSSSDSEAPSSPAMPENNKQSETTPEPYVDTIKTPAQNLESATKPKTESRPEPDPFMETVRMPAQIIEPKVDPFSKTIPGLQNPPKSVH